MIRNQYGLVNGFSADMTDEMIINCIPGAVRNILTSLKKIADEDNGHIDMSTLTIIYHHNGKYDGPLGIEFNGEMCKATIGAKCYIEYEGEEDDKMLSEKKNQRNGGRSIERQTGSESSSEAH